MKLPADPGAHLIHPALHFDGDQAYVGILDAAGVPWVITSDRRKQRAEVLAEQGRLLFAPTRYAPLADRWPEEDLARFLAGDSPPMLGLVLDTIAAVIDHYCELADPRHAQLIATWIIGSYLFPLLTTFPRLHFRGEEGTGKSKLLQLVSLLAFNGLWRIGPTPATLFRLIAPLRPSFCLDEIETLDTTERKDILAIVNAGYKQGGCLDRTERIGDRFEVVPYEVFSPVALGGIARLNKVTADRAIRIHTVKGIDPAKLNREIRPSQGVVSLRGACYRIALLRFRSIRETYQSQSLPPWLVARNRELFLPLLAIARLADTEGSEGVTEDLLSLASDGARERSALPAEIEILLTILQRRLDGTDRVIVRPGELAQDNLTASASQGVNCEAAVLLDGTWDERPFVDAPTHLNRCRAEAMAFDPFNPLPSPTLEQVLVIHAERRANLKDLPWYIHLRPATTDYDKAMRPPAAVWLYLYERGTLRAGQRRPKAASAWSGTLTALNFTDRHPAHRGISADWQAANYFVELNNGIPWLTDPTPHTTTPSQGVFRVDAAQTPETVWLTETPRPRIERVLGETRVSDVDPEFRRFFTKQSVIHDALLHQPYRGVRNVAQLPRREIGSTDARELATRLGLPDKAELRVNETIEERDPFAFIYRPKYRA